MVPRVALAARFQEIAQFFDDFLTFINFTLVPLVFALAFLLFLWGVFQYFFWGSDPAKHEDGRKIMLWSVIGFVAMVTIWGIVNLLASGIGLADPSLQNIPGVPQRI